MTPPYEPDRRDFLKLAGFTLAAAAVPGCSRAPEHEAVPFLEKPEEVTPGIASWYASTCAGCSAACGILAKYRDGRPIKIEGNPGHPVSDGAICAVGQADVLSLYDSKRLRAPRSKAGSGAWKDVTWNVLDEAVRHGLEGLREGGGAVRILTGTLNGPTARHRIEAFLERFADGRHVMYDALSSSALLDAHKQTFGRRVLPRYRFENAQVVVSFEADFLGTWISPVEFTRGYGESRRLTGPERMSRHIQLESRLSLTGCRADERFVLDPRWREVALANLAVYLGRKSGDKVDWKPEEIPGLDNQALRDIAKELWAAPRGRTLVVCGSNRLAEQTLTALINHTLGNYGAAADTTTVDLEQHANQRLGDDAALQTLIEEIEGGKVGALILSDCNPLYDLPEAERLASALERVPLVVSCTMHADETAAAAHFVSPAAHPLETWTDAEPWAGRISVTQPVLRRLGDTRSLIENLSAWSAALAADRALMQDAWREHVFPRRQGGAGFDRFWMTAVHDGHVRVSRAPADATRFQPGGVVRSPAATASPPPVLVLYPKVGPGDGRHAHNPWLQELPDPISKVAWDNYAAIAPAFAKKLDVETGDVVALQVGSVKRELPVLVQRGQHENVVAVALGYGRAGTDRFAGLGPDWLESRPTVQAGGVVGVNAAPLLARSGPYLVDDGQALTVKATGATRTLARTQLHDSLSEPAHLADPDDPPRPMAQETSYVEWQKNHSAGAHAPHDFAALWPQDHPYEGSHWAMSIDLSRCTGCSACVIACQAENNIPVVGKDEVRRKREMHWIRIDRYYDGEGSDVDVAHQPMLCQQCDNAPCESVCPVLATVHSDEGLNQQVYNRCVGTRYCSNNCPYKVRRFNWFNYARDDQMQNMVLNPDVTVRTRGVMEKCTFCVQRIQEGKAEAKRQGRKLRDADVMPACMQSCPADAIAFGDRNDDKSAIVGQLKDERAYRVLEELDVRPSISYLRRVRNRAKKRGKGRGHG